MGILIFWRTRRYRRYKIETAGGDVPLATDASHFTRVDEEEGRAQLLATSIPMTEKEESPASVEALVEANPDAVEAELEGSKGKDDKGEEEVKSPDGEETESGQAAPTSGDVDTTF